MEDSEKILIEQSIEGDREAFRTLVEKYQGRVLRLVSQVVKSREDAEDIVQDSLVKAFVSLKSFKGQSSFYTWLYRIAFNKAIDFKRMVSRRGLASQSELSDLENGKAVISSTLDSIETPAQVVLRKEQAKLIDKAMSELSEEHRSVMILREVDGLSYDEIANITGVTVGTVMSRLHYARKKLQASLKSSEDQSNAKAEEKSLIKKVSQSMLMATTFIVAKRGI